MDRIEQRRTNLAQLIELAQASHGWSRRELARELGRDSSRLIPDSGVPKMDLVVGLARVLEWSVADIVDRVWATEESPVFAGLSGHGSFADLNSYAREAHRVGHYAELVRVARRAYRVADTPDGRALACNREVGGWDGMGCYADALRAAKRGLQERPLSPDIARMLQSNLANTYYGLGLLTEASSVAREVVAEYEVRAPKVMRDRLAQAFAHYVCGQSSRKLYLRAQEPDLALRAKDDLSTACCLCNALSVELSDESYSGIANTSFAGMLEIDALSGVASADTTLQQLAAGLEPVVDCSTCKSGDWLESYGWWCVTGCTIALRSTIGQTRAHEYLAIFTNKADEIAEVLGNWSLRERVITLDYLRRRRGQTHRSVPNLVLDDEDVRNIMGSMGRFPWFRSLGWELLRAARLA